MRNGNQKMDGSEQSGPEACIEKLDMTDFVLLAIGEGVNEIHRSIIAHLCVERNLQTEP